MKAVKGCWVGLALLMVFIASCSDPGLGGDSLGDGSGVKIYSVTATPTASEQISLINNDQSSIDISDWTLGDLNNPVAYGMPFGTILSPGQVKTFIHTTLGFQINDSGEVIYLKDGTFVTRDTWLN